MMDHRRFQAWLPQVDRPSAAQRREAGAVLSGGSRASASLAAIEAGVGEDLRRPHCGTPCAVPRGKARGLRRYRCKGCGKTFNAAAGAPLAGLHRKEGRLAFGTCPADGETVRTSAARCGPARRSAAGAGSLPPEAGIRESPPALPRPTEPACWKAAGA